ncbi:hypothetical protein VTK73DRAFT_6809 [Phialemonium thermophilum]|uniref:Cytochrome P450 n=1 Tax=Phialemonium thermophilum TaxID=223376 RepID=A0ABR3Y756_9PEZI
MAVLSDLAVGLLPRLLCLSLTLIPVVILLNLLYRFTSTATLPDHLPWAGLGGGGGKYSRLKAYLRSLFDMKSLVDEGYTRYSKHGRVYVLPHFLTGPEVVLPLSQVPWLTEQPESILSQTDVNRQFLEADYTFLHPNIVREPVHPDVIKRELTHKLSSFADDIIDELRSCLDDVWGSDTENWKEVRVYDSMVEIISRLSLRVFVGMPLCRNREFLHAARMFDKNVVLPAAILNLLPEFLKPIVAPFVTLYDRLQYLTCAKYILPEINRRLEQLQIRGGKTEDSLLQDKPDDYIQWAIDHALAHWDPVELSASVISRRFSCICFAAIQSSVISITNALFDLASSPDCAAHLATMRAEVLRETTNVRMTCKAQEINSSYPRGGAEKPSTSTTLGLWDKASLARMVHVDSALRESMRLNGFVVRGIMKTVVAPEGVVLPDGTTRLPQGAKVGIQAYSVHRDTQLYGDDAERYRAFRFVPHPSVDSDGGDAAESKTRQPQALVSTSPTFLAFSYGPNACPGRFFAANQLKMTLAYIALHYEIDPICERPENKWFVGSMAPPMWETLKVRRRRN